MPYAEHPPPPALAAFVRCAWTFESAACNAVLERIVPDGRCELIVHFGDPYAEADGTPQPRVLFAGQLTRPLWVRSRGRAGVLGIRFHPATARRFLGMPLHHATDARIDMARLDRPGTRALADAVKHATDGAARAALAAEYVSRRIALHPHDGDAPVARCVASLESSRGAATIGELERVADVGRRQLERRFRDAVGVAPAMLARILRFRAVFDAIEHDAARPWTDAALAAGYFDQSHLVREFRRFVGCTPTAFATARPGLASALVEPA